MFKWPYKRVLYLSGLIRGGPILYPHSQSGGYIAITLSVRPLLHPSVHTFVTDISASTGRNDFIFDIWLWHGDLYHISPFQVYRTSTSCLQCDLEFFMFAVMKTFVTVISASNGRNDFIFDIWLWHGDLYRVPPFQVYRTSTSCLQCDLQMNEWGYSQHDVACNILFNIEFLRYCDGHFENSDNAELLL